MRVIHGDMLAVLPTLEAESIHAVVTDPPYHLASIVKRFGKEGSAPAQHGTDGAFARASKGFMGQTWDGGDIAFRPETWAAVLRVMKPGAHLVAFGASRNYHRMACAIEDAGFEIRDSLMWLYGSGFPKSHDISKAIDKAAGAEREVVGTKLGQPGYSLANNGRTNEVYGDLHNPAAECAITAPATPEAAQWAGWGSALKPAYEPILLARKPLSGTLAANTLRHGVGGINIDACWIPGAKPDTVRGGGRQQDGYGMGGQGAILDDGRGRFPANVLHDGSPEVMAAFEAFGESKSPPVGSMDGGSNKHSIYGDFADKRHSNGHGDTGSAARFFFCGKADADDRAGTTHPTTKPTSLMIWLTKLICPPGGTILDPFAGSGSTGVACVRQGFDAVLIEQSVEYIEMIKSRLRQEGVRGQEADLTKPQPEHEQQLALGLF